ncbi:MAG: SRPBCC domain-containing protein [Phycisphaerales bacterium]
MTTAKTEQTTGARTLERSLSINAPIDAVWKALTDAEELMNWFPPEATVEPGPGGKIFMRWGDFWQGESDIEVWEPPHHLRTSFDAGVARTAVDYYLERDGNATTLRLVHSGFGKGDDWNTAYDGIRRGWRAELSSLRNYLENHRGQTRVVAGARAAFPGSDEAGWAKLRAALDLPTDVAPGDRLDITIGDDRVQGRVVLSEAPCQLCAIADITGGVTTRQAYFRIELDRCAGSPNALLWLGAFDIDGAEAERVEARWTQWLVRAFAN